MRPHAVVPAIAAPPSLGPLAFGPWRSNPSVRHGARRPVAPSGFRMVSVLLVLCWVAGFSLIASPLPGAEEDPYTRAMEMISRGDAAQAETLLSDLLSRSPDHVDAWVARGVARQQQGNTRGAIADYDQALAMAPDHARALGNRASAWYQRGRPNPCLMDCDRLLARVPNAPGPYLLRGTARQSVGRWAGARRDLERAVTLAPEDPVILNQLSWFLATCPQDDLRDGRLAVELAERALKTADSPAILDSLAAAYADSGRFQQAAAVEEKVIQRSLGKVPDAKIEAYNQRLALYRAQRPWRQPHPLPPPYTIQISACQDRAGALSRARELREGGAPAFCAPAEIPKRGTWYRIYMDRYPSLADMAAAAEHLGSRFEAMQFVCRPYTVVLDKVPDSGDAGGRLLSDAGCLPDPAGWIGAFETAEEAARLARKLETFGIPGRVVGSAEADAAGRP